MTILFHPRFLNFLPALCISFFPQECPIIHLVLTNISFQNLIRILAFQYSSWSLTTPKNVVSWPYKAPSVPLPPHQQCPILFDFSTDHTNYIKLFHLLYVQLLCQKQTVSHWRIVLHHLKFNLCQCRKLWNNHKHTKQKTVPLDLHTHNRTHLSTDAGKSSSILTEAPLKTLTSGLC